MKGKRYIQSFGQFNENLNISDVMKSLSVEEQEMIEKGKKTLAFRYTQ